jgi:ectoine hydroxylase-related dioxygenase (phytanoyl-CoA dioxygenase family)
VIPGGHKANFPLPPNADLSDMEVEIPMRAGSVLLFTHDMYHASLNTSDKVRRVVIFTYCPGVISNTYGGYGGNALYERLFEKASEGSWLKYLLRRPNGGGDSYPKPDGRPYDAG